MTVFMHSYLLEGVVLEKLVWRRGVVITGGAMLRQVSDCFDGVFMLLFFSFVYRLCASLMSRLVLVIMLLQRPGVIGILLILIYSLYRKNMHFGSYYILVGFFRRYGD
jgi:hypothetical protein